MRAHRAGVPVENLGGLGEMGLGILHPRFPHSSDESTFVMFVAFFV
jgi:hypothetical protein